VADTTIVSQGAVCLEFGNHLRHGRRLLPDTHIDTFDAGVLLVDDRVQPDRRLSGLPVADDQLALSAPDGRCGVHDLDSRL
jgi:hypothetical protein